MTTETCNHKYCDGPPISKGYARYKYVEGKGMVPFHTACSYAGEDYDVRKGTGSPFTTITLHTI